MSFNSLSAELRQQRHQMHDTCRQFNRSPSRGNLQRIKALFLSCGDEVFIESGFHCDYGDKITLGDRVYFNINCTLLDGGLITIGDDCLIGPYVQILTINHATSPRERLAKASFAQDVSIANNVWLGAGVIILPGLCIGSGAVIAAGSVVTKNIPENSLYSGNPAKFIRLLE
ncbi:sugar O-acetyltransferase [sulfur-oxidizing endosymbiont of Gigantopelta aegis]|uniref:sugar O-acetyltransferase n=1 Tax=sulfur-oxidizing endosymbiont of Gigantopelta aegis TaxID=2794934 RepID=UPI0018DBE350|nr:sugar O-acetyltransferase [sulfur-oxidizing endosymbiont of Gigantopelta aegis]